MAIFGLATITMAQMPNYVPINGLVGYWPFTGNANDLSGNNLNGTVNGATLTTDRFGNLNKAYSFNGVSSYIQNISIVPNIDTTTISCWVYLNGDQGGCYVQIGADYTGNSNGIGIGNGGTSFINNGLELLTLCSSVGWNYSTYFVNSQNWFHYIVVKKGNLVTYYINGINLGSQTILTPLQPSNSIYFGSSSPNTFFFNGKIDDIGVWNLALTQQEITDLYNGCSVTVTTQPINNSVNISNNAQFTTSSSDPLATYQWQTDLGTGFQNLNSVGQYSGTSNVTLNVANVTMSNNNQPFRCIINSGSCSDTSNVAVLTVNNNVGINEFTQDNLFSVYPNPANSQINVKADANLLGSIYTVYDNTGKVVLSGKINSENTVIELGNLSGGIYLFTVGENMKQTFKVIKE